MNKKRKGVLRALAVCSAAVMMMASSGCAKGGPGGPGGRGPGGAQQGGKIAVITKQQLSFWDDVKKGAEDACSELGYELIYTVADGDNDYVSQVAAINDAIKKDARAIVIAPNGTTELNEAFEKAEEKGIKIININSLADYDGVISLISSSETDGGGVAERSAVKALAANKYDFTKGVKVGIIGHTASTAEKRIEGFADVFTQQAAFKALQAGGMQDMGAAGDAAQQGGDQAQQGGAAGTAGSDDAMGAIIVSLRKNIVEGERCAKRDDAKAQAKKLLGTDGNGINVMFGTTTNTTLGICDAVEELGLAGKIVVVGFNSDEQELAFIRKGVLNGVVVQNPYIMGYVGVRYAKKVLDGTNVPNRLDTGATFVNADNLNDPFIQLLLYPDSY